jgi:hypothetical protein
MEVMRLEQLLYGPRRLTKSTRLAATIAFVVGGLVLMWSSYIHFHLWRDLGYRHIQTIGPLFILQTIAGVVLGLGVLAIRRVWIALLGVGFAISTMVGFLLSVERGLFGFKDTWLAPFAKQAFFLEVAAIVVLVVAGTLCLAGSPQRPETVSPPTGVPSGA